MRLLAVGVAAACVAFASGSALAADMPVKAPPPAPPPPAPFSWTGCYLGGQVGWASMRDRDRETDPTTGTVTTTTPFDAARDDGVKAGGHLGCNWQWAGPLVLGIEGDAEWADLKAKNDFVGSGTPPDFYESRIRFQASVRGRLGWAFDRSLFYVTGGVAWADVKHTYVDQIDGLSESFKKTLTGWTVGGGWEYAFTNNWSARAEYRYADFGDVTHTPDLFALDERHKITEHSVRFGLTYRFGNFGAPVAARY